MGNSRDCLGLLGELLKNCDSYIPLMNLLNMKANECRTRKFDDIVKRTVVSVASLRRKLVNFDNLSSPSVEISTDLQ